MMMDEAHPTHVSREIEDEIDISTGIAAGRQAAEVSRPALDIIEVLMPGVEWLGIDCSKVAIAPAPQLSHEVPANEAASAGDQNAQRGREDLGKTNLCHLSQCRHPARPALQRGQGRRR